MPILSPVTNKKGYVDAGDFDIDFREIAYPIGAIQRASPTFYTDPITRLPKIAAANEPTIEAEGLRLQGQSTNVVRRSGELGSSNWANGSYTPDANVQFGDLVLQHFSEGVGTFNRRAQSTTSYTFAAGAVVTLSWFMAPSPTAADKSRLRMIFTLGNSTEIRGQCFTGGTINGVSAGADYTLLDFGSTPYGQGLYRFWVTFQLVTAQTMTLRLTDGISGSISAFEGNGTGGLCKGGVQIEEGALSSYIRTEGAAVTRAGDSLSLVTPESQPVASYMLLDAKLSGMRTSAGRLLRWEKGDSWVQISSGTNTPGGNQGRIQPYIRSGGTSDIYGPTNTIVPTAGVFKFAMYWNPASSPAARARVNDSNYNGGSTTFTPPVMSNFNCSPPTGLIAHLARLSYRAKAVSDSEMNNSIARLLRI